MLMTDFVEKNMDVGLEGSTTTCVWNTGNPCAGKIHTVSMFKNQITAPVCAEHYTHHFYIMLLNKSGQDIEDELGLTEAQLKDNLNNLYGIKEINRDLCEKVLSAVPNSILNLSAMSDKEVFDAFVDLVG